MSIRDWFFTLNLFSVLLWGYVVCIVICWVQAALMWAASKSSAISDPGGQPRNTTGFASVINAESPPPRIAARQVWHPRPSDTTTRRMAQAEQSSVSVQCTRSEEKPWTIPAHP